ncbi:MAG: hypothetical protein IKH86_08815 [Prevotella sp.]|nr:hypothetical protein [Prevotella sp.]
MKKIFTLIAMALMAMGVNAQNTWSVAEDTEVGSGTSITSIEGVTLNIGNESDGNDWSIGDATKDLGEGNDVLGTTFYIKGSENAKTNGSTTKNGKVPETGTYYQFVLTKSGTLTVGVNWGKDKIMRFADEDGAEIWAEKNETGASFFGTKEFECLPGTYYLYAEGSKLGFFGFSFEEKEVVEDTGTPHEAQAWDFQSKLSENDLANLAADEENWVAMTDDEGNVEGYQNVNKLVAEKVMANGVELELTKGLNFNAGVSKFQYFDGKRLAHGGNGHGPIISECAKDDVVKLRYMVNSSERGFNVANMEVTDGFITGDPDASYEITDDEGNSKTVKVTFEVTLSVKKKGDVSFASISGADILALAINTDLPDEPVEDGISSLAAESSKANKGIFNLAGQQVSKAVKGIYVIGGKKFVVK